MQYYMVVKSEDKLNVLYSFLKTHHKQKVLIFTGLWKILNLNPNKFLTNFLKYNGTDHKTVQKNNGIQLLMYFQMLI